MMMSISYVIINGGCSMMLPTKNYAAREKEPETNSTEA
jgi:hypothetical protein